MFIFGLLNLFRISSFEFVIVFMFGGHRALDRDARARGASLKSEGIFQFSDAGENRDWIAFEIGCAGLQVCLNLFAVPAQKRIG